MTKRKAPATKSIQPKVENAQMQNGLAEAIGIGGGVNPYGFPFNQGVAGTAQVENTATMFRNLRYYFVSNMRQLLSQAYCEIGLVQTICDVPVDDAFRGGITIQSKDLDEDQILELINAIDEHRDLEQLKFGQKMNRLFGGAGVLILTDQDPETPLDMKQIQQGDDLEFRGVDMWELYFDMQAQEGFNPVDGLYTKSYDPMVTGDSTQSEYFSYYGIKVHRSRVMILKGIEAPSFVRPRLRGWGLSVVETLVRSLNQYLKSTDLAFEVLDEFKVDIFKMKNLVNTLMSPDGTNKVRRRVELANMEKNFLKALVMDSEDDWDHKQLSFAGLAEVMQQIRMQVASDMRMPITKLFGISANGFNSGEDDIEVYNGMVESQIRGRAKYDIMKIVRMRALQQFGIELTDLSIGFHPLRVMSTEQEEKAKNDKFSRLQQSLATNAITLKEFRDAVNKGKLMDITLSDDEMLELEQTREAGNEDDAGDDGSQESGKPKVENSAEFDRRSYEADGGDSWIDSRREEFFKHPRDRGLWSQVTEISQKVYGAPRWQFQVWLYLKRGGKF